MAQFVRDEGVLDQREYPNQNWTDRFTNFIPNVRAFLASTTTFTVSGIVSIATLAVLILLATRGVYMLGHCGFEDLCDRRNDTKMIDVGGKSCVDLIMHEVTKNVLSMDDVSLHVARWSLGFGAAIDNPELLDRLCANLSQLTVSEVRNRSSACLINFWKNHFVE